MNWIADDRLLTNLIGLHIILGGILFVSVVLRRIIMHGGSQLVRWTGLHWLDGFCKEAVRHIRSLRFWTTLGLRVLVVVGGVVFIIT